MTFTEFAEFGEPRQNPKVVWLERHSIFDKRYIPRCSSKKIFPLLPLGWYLFTVVSHNGYLTRGSNGNAHSITMNGNVPVASWVKHEPLATLPVLNFVKIH